MKKHILIIDDDEELCEELQMLLQGEGYRVTSANDGCVGLDLVAKSRYDLVMVDLKLPTMSGPELIKEIRARFPTQKIVVFSGKPSMSHETQTRRTIEERKDEALIQLADGFINKPCKPAIIIETIKSVLS